MKIKAKIFWTLLSISSLVALVGALAVNRQHVVATVGAIKEAENIARALGLLLSNGFSSDDQEMIANLHKMQGRDVVLVDINKLVLADAVPSDIGKKFTEDPGDEVGATLRDRQARTFIEISSDSPRPIKQIVVPAQDYSGHVIGAVILEYTPLYDELMQSTRTTTRQVILGGLLGVMIAFVIASFIGRSVVVPLQQLRDVATAFASGKVDVPMPPPRRDEIGELANAFDNMVQKRRQAEEELRHARDELEIRVTERTAELAKSNEALQVENAERARAEEELRKSEKLFAAFMSHFPGFAWMKDLEGRYTYANAMLAQLEPYREGWLGKTDADLWPAEIASAYRANDETVIATAKPLQAIEQYLWDNEVSQVLVSKFPIFDSIGAVEMVGGASIDITEKKQAEKALAEQVLRYRTLMETSTDSIYVIDTSGNLQEANAEFLRRRGYSAAEAKGLNVADWDAQWTREELQERTRKLVGSNAVFETRHRCKDGSVFDVEVGVTSVQVADKQLFFCVTREITERKKAENARRESEERFRQIAENINEVFWVWTATPGKPRLLYVSPAYETIWGRSCESLYSLPQSWKEALHPNDKEWVLAQIADLDLEKMNDLTYRIVRPDRSIRWIRDRIFPVRDGRDVVIRFAGIAEDITERKKVEERLEHSAHLLQTFSRRLLKVQEEERRHLARELHDEIGQTLTAAKLNLQSATGDGGSVTSARLQETTAILDRLLGQVRQMSLDLRPSMLDDLGLVPALRSLLNQQGRRASVAVRFSAEDVPDKLDSEIQTTCFRIGQEGITNAVRHGGATQINVDLRCANGKLRLLICDNGIGFDAESVRAQTAGLGLIGIKERAALLDGRAKITSSLNKGTTIEISLPLTFRRAHKSRPARK